MKIGGLAFEHTLHGDAAAIRALSLVARFGVGSFVVGSAPQTAAHVNFVFAGFPWNNTSIKEVRLMHRSCVTTIVINSNKLEASIHFWTNALGTTVVEADEVFTYLGPVIGNLRVVLQKVPDEQLSKNHMHIDFETDNLEAEVQRLEALGAQRLRFIEHWWNMQDPCGVEFCVCEAHSPQFDERAHLWNC